MRIDILKKGDTVLSVNKEFIAVQRANGEVELVPFEEDEMGLRVNTSKIVTIGYGNNTVSAKTNGVTITNYQLETTMSKQRPPEVIAAQKAYRQEKGNFYCVICGSRRGTTHHLIPYALGGSTDDNNFITLCREHHDLVEQGKIGISRYL